MLLPLTLYKFADALVLMPRAARATEAQAIIAEAGAMARKHSDLHGTSYAWGDFVDSVCLTRQNDYRVRHNVPAAPFAALTDRDGLQAYEVAIYALTDMVRDAERVAA